MVGDRVGGQDGRDGQPQGGGGDAGAGGRSMTTAEFRYLLRYGVPATLEVYRRAYAAVGMAWPGDAAIRRRHRVIPAGQVTDLDRWGARLGLVSPWAADDQSVSCVEVFERGWDAALDLAQEVVRDCRDGNDARARLEELAGWRLGGRDLAG